MVCVWVSSIEESCLIEKREIHEKRNDEECVCVRGARVGGWIGLWGMDGGGGVGKGIEEKPRKE